CLADPVRLRQLPRPSRRTSRPSPGPVTPARSLFVPESERDCAREVGALFRALEHLKVECGDKPSRKSGIALKPPEQFARLVLGGQSSLWRWHVGGLKADLPAARVIDEQCIFGDGRAALQPRRSREVRISPSERTPRRRRERRSSRQFAPEPKRASHRQ